MSTIATSTASTATAYPNQRKVARCSNGIVWAMYNPTYDGYSGVSGTTNLMFSYSADGGSTWTSSGFIGNQSGNASNSFVPNGSLFIDVDDYAHVAYKDNSNGYLYYRRGTPNAGRTAWTWSAALQVGDQTYMDHPDVVAHREGSGWVVHVVCDAGSQSVSNKIFYGRVVLSSTGSATSTQSLAAIGSSIATANGAFSSPSIDFNHNGDGKTVAGSPHLYVAWSNGNSGTGYGIRFAKGTYSSGPSWAWGAEVAIDENRQVASNGWLKCNFDGVGVVMVGSLYYSMTASTNTIMYGRDAANTVTTSATILRTHLNGSFTLDSHRNIYVIGQASQYGASQIGWSKYDITAKTTSSQTLVGSDVSTWASFVFDPGNRSLVYASTMGSSSPFSIFSGVITANSLPLAPINIVVDTPIVPGASASIDYTHNDPDGDPQVQVQARWRKTAS